jgi:hypothetical protein
MLRIYSLEYNVISVSEFHSFIDNKIAQRRWEKKGTGFCEPP